MSYLLPGIDSVVHALSLLTVADAWLQAMKTRSGDTAAFTASYSAPAAQHDARKKAAPDPMSLELTLLFARLFPDDWSFPRLLRFIRPSTNKQAHSVANCMLSLDTQTRSVTTASFRVQGQ